METSQYYAYATAAWLSVQAVPLLLMPGVLTTILRKEPASATDLETHFARIAGLALLFLALLTLLLTGTIPLSARPSANTTTDPDTPPTSPYTSAAVTVTAAYHAAAAVHSYTSYVSRHSAPLALGATASGLLAIMGLWCVMFAGEGHVSRRTGADKRTSGWPFRNAEAEKKKAGKRRM